MQKIELENNFNLLNGIFFCIQNQSIKMKDQN